MSFKDKIDKLFSQAALQAVSFMLS